MNNRFGEESCGAIDRTREAQCYDRQKLLTKASECVEVAMVNVGVCAYLGVN